MQVPGNFKSRLVSWPYRHDFSWRRNRLFEALGSCRYSRPGTPELTASLAPYLPDEPGVFFEAGAHDGYTFSNTYYLERWCGWNGILVEAAPELHRKASARRQASHISNCALVRPEEVGSTVLHFGDLTSTIEYDLDHLVRGLRNAGRKGYSVDVPARTISSVIDESGFTEIDLMVLDIEGAEFDALSGVQFDRHPVKLLVVEMLDMERQRAAFEQVLAPWFAAPIELTPWDMLFVAHGHPSAAGPPTFSTPTS